MYTSPASLTLGFHGCDKAVAESLLCGKIAHLNKSQNNYDWLGHGVYFWENNPQRALAFAHELRKKSRRDKTRVMKPFVIGAVIDLANCLNLTESKSLELLASSYQYLKGFSEQAGIPMPKNHIDAKSGEPLRRELDCAVIETLHNSHTGPAFDTVRGVFQEGREIYPSAGFREKTHVQICVRNTACIKGYFRLLPED